ncbi:MAG: hypothetical protein KGJ27_12975, partial [candidate division NC10 bacterium]|nr:hypothetical protein [candidate division NC10 bacterium]
LVITGVIAASINFLLKKGTTSFFTLIPQIISVSGMIITLVLFGSDVVLLTIPLLFIFVLFQAEKQIHHFSGVLFLALCAFIGLIKFTFAICGFTMVLCAEMYRFSKGKYLPIYLGTYMLFFALFFLLAHQHLENLVAFITTSLEVAGGYSEAMQLFSPSGEIMAFIGLVFCLLILIACAEWRFGRWREGDWRGLILLLSIVIFNFITFKAGFVRHDGHTLIAWGSLVICITIYSTRFYQDVPVRTWRLALAILFISAAGMSMWYDARHHFRNPLNVVRLTLTRRLSKRIVAIKELGLNERVTRLSEEYRAALEKIRNANPFPPIQGAVDLYPWDESLILAHGLRYAPRPVFQSYSAYSKPLIDANRTHLRDEKAPTTLLFDVQTIDSRFPAMEDGASWPDIWARYDPIDVSGDYLILTRRTTARMVQIVPVATTAVPFSKPLKMPQVSGLTWVAIDVKKTMLGTVMNLLFKLPILELDLTMADGSTRIERIVPNVASMGFVINPVIESNADFAQVSLNNRAQLAPSDQAVAMTIEGPEYVSWLYNNAIRVSVSTLTIDGRIERKPSPKLLAGSHAPTRSLRILAPPTGNELHPAREGGHVDELEATGNKIYVSGWVKLDNTERDQTITVTSSIRPGSYFLKTVKRPDVASALRNEGLAQSGFRIILRFDSPASANRAAKELCVYAQSETTSVTVVHSNNQLCRRLLPG